MKILMKATIHGSLDGETVQQLDAETEYDTVDGPRGDRLARFHIAKGVAVAAGRAGASDRWKQPAQPDQSPELSETRSLILRALLVALRSL